MPRGCLQFVIVVFPDHTHLLFLIINNDKSVWVPCQCLVWLVLLWNLIKGVLEIPEARLHKVENAILDILNSLYGVSARKLLV